VAALRVVLPLEHFVVRSDRYPALPGLACVVVECVLFALNYLSALRVISPGRYRSVRDVVVRALAELTGLARR
jgi:PST family polysaccharide transporter